MTVTPFERSSSRIRTNRTRKSPTGVGFEHDHGPRYEFNATDAGHRLTIAPRGVGDFAPDESIERVHRSVSG